LSRAIVAAIVAAITLAYRAIVAAIAANVIAYWAIVAAIVLAY